MLEEPEKCSVGDLAADENVVLAVLQCALGGTNELVALDPTTGKVKWQSQVNVKSAVSPAEIVNMSPVVVYTGDSKEQSEDGWTPRAVGLDLSTGKRSWKKGPTERPMDGGAAPGSAKAPFVRFPDMESTRVYTADPKNGKMTPATRSLEP